ETPMQTSFVNKSSPEPAESFGEALLDLGPLEPARFVETDDVILDIDFDAAVEAPSFGRAFTASVAADSFTTESRDIAEASPVTENEFVDSSHIAPEAAAHFVDSDVVAGAADSEREAFAQPQMTSRAAGRGEASPLTLDQLSPEVIDAIARRVVEQMSEKAVQEIAWEVVPQLADLM